MTADCLSEPWARVSVNGSFAERPLSSDLSRLGLTFWSLLFSGSLSLVPPSAKSVEHLHEDFVNDAPAIGWVNSTPAISLIFSSATTMAAGDRRGEDFRWDEEKLLPE